MQMKNLLGFLCYVSVLWGRAAKIDLYLLTEQHAGLWLSSRRQGRDTERDFKCTL